MSKKMKILLGVTLSAAGIIIFSIAGVVLYIYSLSRELPSIKEVSSFRYNEPMVVYDANGVVIAELGPERRYPVPMKKIPKHMVQAVIAVEDARFYEHKGIDVWGIARAFMANIRAGRVVEGGSTLTQQLVKVIYLNPEKKLKRKIKEAILAYRIDNYLTKEQVLELYLNQVNFGRGAYGVQAAAINYFGKNVEDLTLSEAALFAGIPKGPSIFAPHINLERAILRRNHVLYRMYEVGYITEGEYNSAAAEPIIIKDSVPLRLKYAGYFMDYVQKYLADKLGIKDINTSAQGWKVYTTLRIDYQLEAEKAVFDNLMEVAKREGYYGPFGTMVDNETHSLPVETESGDKSVVGVKKAKNKYHDKLPLYLANKGIKKAIVAKVEKEEVTLLLQDNSTGVIRMKNSLWAKPYGSTQTKLLDFKSILKEKDIVLVSENERETGVYNLEQDPALESALISMDPVTGAIYAMVGGLSYEKSFYNRAYQAYRQTGSTFKPIVYAAAFERGFFPMDIMFDIPIIAEEEDGEWRPNNYGDRFVGKTTIKDALLKSNNIVTIKLAEKVGINRIVRYAKNFGFSSNIPTNDSTVSIGSASGSVLEMALAYSAFANQGLRPAEPYFITKIENAEGKVLYEFNPKEPIKVLDEAGAQVITELLVDTVEKGGAWRAKGIPRISGGKTGTTNDSKDGWYAGFLPNIVTVVWVGYDDFRKLGSYATGSSVAAPAWVKYMKAIVDTIPIKMFPASDKTAYFKVDNETKQITDAIVGNFTYEIFPVDGEGKPIRLKLNK